MKRRQSDQNRTVFMARSDHSGLWYPFSKGHHDLVHSCDSRDSMAARIERLHCGRTGASALDICVDPYGLEITIRPAAYLVMGSPEAETRNVIQNMELRVMKPEARLSAWRESHERA